MRMESSGLARGSSVMLLSIILGGSITFAISAVVARLLTEGEFGLLTVFISIQNTVVIFASFGVPRTLAKLIPELRVNRPADATLISCLGIAFVSTLLVVTLGTYVALAGVIGEDILHSYEIADLIPFSALAIAGQVLLLTVSAISQGFQKIGAVAYMRILNPFFCLAMVIVVVPSTGLSGVFLSYFVSQTAIAAIFYTYIARLQGPVHICHFRRIGPDIRRRFMRFSFLSFASNLIVVPVLLFANAKLLLNHGPNEMAWFGVAYIIFTALIMIPAAISTPLLPKISEVSASRPEVVQDILRSLLRRVSLLVLPLILFLVLFSREVTCILYGAPYSDAQSAVVIMSIASYPYMVSSVIGIILIGTGRMRQFFASQVGWAVSLVGLVLVLVPSYGADGLSGAFVGAYLALMVVSGTFLQSSSRISLKDSHILVAGILCALSAVCVWKILQGESPLAVRMAILASALTITVWLLRRDIMTLTGGVRPRS